MSNVIQGNFGVDSKDIDLLGSIYGYAGVDCNRYSADPQFCALSNYSLKQEKAIRMVYEDMQRHVIELSDNFYKNGQTEKDLKLFTDFRQSFQNFELLVADTMR